MSDTIFAVSSGAPPAAIAILRISGPAAGNVARAVAGDVPAPRVATLRRLRDVAGETLDRALVLWFPAPASATGEDVLELHVHGGRAVIAAVERAVAAVPGTRRAEAGEFTRRALRAGRMDFSEASALADLLEAETEAQRRAAVMIGDGALTRELAVWLDRLSEVRAIVEAAIDYDDEGEVPTEAAWAAPLAELGRDLRARLATPTSERVREGWRVVITGPPNAGKSSLFNAMLGREAAIVTPVAGTTRDRIEAQVRRGGALFTLVDTAGLAEWTGDAIEAEGMRRAREVASVADLVLWMSDAPPPEDVRAVLRLRGRCDLPGREDPGACDLGVSARRPHTVDRLWAVVQDRLAGAMPGTAVSLIDEHRRRGLEAASDELVSAAGYGDLLLSAEHLRRAASHLTALLGADPTEAMLDALFARFCVGK